VSSEKVTVPDIGDFEDVPVIEILVSEGDEVSAEDPLVTLESDKATMDVPAPFEGTVEKLEVSIGDRVSQGSLLMTVSTGGGGDQEDASDEPDEDEPDEDEPDADEPDADESDADESDADESDADESGEDESDAESTDEDDADADADESEAEATDASVKSEPAPADGDDTPDDGDDSDRDFQVVVLGSGPGGYTAAFRAADLGLKVALIERYDRLGGVCLNVGCIPSKALLHAARVIAETEEMATHGISFGAPKLQLGKLVDWKQSIVDRLTGGLAQLAKQRKVEVIHGEAKFVSSSALQVGEREVSFDNCIIAAGSEAASIPDLPDDPRVIGSTGALSPDSVPGKLLVIGGGIIGLEMACVYDALGAKVTVVEMLDQLMPGADPDLVRPLAKRIGARYTDVLTSTRVESVKAQKNGLKVEIGGVGSRLFDQVLIAVGRVPNGNAIDADAAGVNVDDSGFIAVDEQMRTNVKGIYAIGDIVGGPMLAHKATHEAKVAAEVIAGQDVAFDARGIPSVAYTDPEVAWIGLTETAAKEQDVKFEKATFPWAASGRALGLGRDEGLTKLLVERDTQRVLGCGIVGVNAGDLISEAALALEMGADAQDIALTVHPHPTLSETVAFSAELIDGSITDLMPPRKRS
jgi:dihydrolipoamide dehydrogenase